MKKKNNFKLLIFTIFTVFFLSVSSAEEDNYLFLLSTESALEVVGCPMDPVTGRVSDVCLGSHNAASPLRVGNITAITAFQSKSPIFGEAHGILYAAGTRGLARCFVSGWSGLVGNCEKNSYVNDMKILKMAVNPSKWLYYLTSESLGVCKLESLKVRDISGIHSNCHIILTGLKDATGVALSPNGKFVYITEKGAPSLLVVCPVLDDGELGRCENNSNPQLKSPAGIAIDHIGPYAYIIDSNSESEELKSCKLTNRGHTIESCKSYPSVPGFTTGAKSITLSANGYYSYISYPTKNSIVRCTLHNGEYKHCKVDLNYESPQEITYY